MKDALRLGELGGREARRDPGVTKDLSRVEGELKRRVTMEAAGCGVEWEGDVRGFRLEVPVPQVRVCESRGDAGVCSRWEEVPVAVLHHSRA